MSVQGPRMNGKPRQVASHTTSEQNSMTEGDLEYGSTCIFQSVRGRFVHSAQFRVVYVVA